ncbi:MAG: phage holin family protein [Flavobacteriales bacterium]|nr:phage holin family protein [Flavobacteriales bacterium]NNK81273.1 phage holin family protein [Flavobacteriales bacterium]
MKLLIKIALSTLAVFGLAYLLNGIQVDAWQTALLVAVILGLLNTFLRPVLILLTIPITIVTLGLFLLVINAGIVLLCDNLITGFSVDSFWWALGFSILLSIAQGILYRLFGVKGGKHKRKKQA